MAAFGPGLHGLVEGAAAYELAPGPEPHGPPVTLGAHGRAAGDRHRITGVVTRSCGQPELTAAWVAVTRHGVEIAEVIDIADYCQLTGETAEFKEYRRRVLGGPAR